MPKSDSTAEEKQPLSHFYLESTSITGDICRFSPEESHHIVVVCRHGQGDTIKAADGRGRLHTVRITGTDSAATTGRILKSESNVNELSTDITVAFGLMPMSKTEEVIDQLTQLGVNRLQPLRTEKSAVKLDRRKLNLKLERWRRLGLSSMKQSLRCRLPAIAEPCTVAQLAEQVDKFDVALFGSLHGQVTAAAKTVPATRILLITGPEGGFSDREEELWLQAGVRAVTLGERRLRAELAPVVLTTMVLCWGM